MAAALAAMVAACSPALDWREVTWPEGGFVVVLPGRPSAESRRIRFGDHDLQMTMLHVRADPFLYGAGYAPLPDGLDAAARGRVAEWALHALAGNFDAKEPTIRDARVGGHPCYDLEAAGSVQARAVAVRGRVCVTGRRLHQLLVIGPADRIGDADAPLFLQSLRFTD